MELLEDVLIASQPQSEDKETYIKDTAYGVNSLDVDTKFTDSRKITTELFKQAKMAMESRIDGCKEYTKARLERINLNWNRIDAGDSGDLSFANLSMKETFNEFENWSDDLTMIFRELHNYLEVEDDGHNVEEYIAKTLSVEPADLNSVSKKHAMMLALTKRLPESVRRGLGLEGLNTDATFHFQRGDILKSFMKNRIARSAFPKLIEDFINSGIASGSFWCRDYWGDNQTYRLKSGDEGLGLEIDSEDIYKFTPLDPRNLIHRKTKKHSWLIEKKPDVKFSDLLTHVLDDEGKVKPDAIYDYEMLKKVAEYLKSKGSKQDQSSKSDSELEQMESDEILLIDGDINFYEGHHIPLVFPGGKHARKAMISAINIGDENNVDLVIIQAVPTPYVLGLPYHSCTMFNKGNDPAGVGVPELLEKLEDIVNEISGFSTDICNLGLYGIMLIDADCAPADRDMKQVMPRDVIKLKNLKGRTAQQVVEWLHPPTENVTASEQRLERLLRAIKRTARSKGGEKQPNPVTATEITDMITEMQKSTNKVALRVNDLLIEVLDRMYQYSLMNATETIKLKSKAYLVKGSKELALKMEGQLSNADHDVSEKVINLTPTEIFVEGLRFKLKAIDNFQIQAVEKQQTMQTVTTLYNVSAFIDIATGQPKVYKDETGAEMVLSEYKLISKFLRTMNMDDMFERNVQTGPAQGQMSPPLAPTAGTPTTAQSPQAPPQSAEPTTAAVLNQVSNGTEGVTAGS